MRHHLKPGAVDSTAPQAQIRPSRPRLLRPRSRGPGGAQVPHAPGLGRATVGQVAETDTRRSLRAAPAVMHSTADRFDAVLIDESLSEAEVLDRLALEAEELCRAMETLDRELEGLAE